MIKLLTLCGVVLCLILLTTDQVSAAPSNSSTLAHHKTSGEGSDVWNPFEGNASNNSAEQAGGNGKDSEEKLHGSGADETGSSSNTKPSRVRKSLNGSEPTGPPTKLDGSNGVNVTRATSPPRRSNSTIRYKPRRRNSSVKKPMNGTAVASNSTGDLAASSNTTVKSPTTVTVPLNRTRREVDVILFNRPNPPAVLIFEFNTTPRPEDDDEVDVSNETANANTSSSKDEDDQPISVSSFHNAHGPAPISADLAVNSSEEIQPTNHDSDFTSQRKRRQTDFFEFLRSRNGTSNAANASAPNSDEVGSVEGSQDFNTTSNGVLTFTSIFIHVFRVPQPMNASDEENSTETQGSDDFRPTTRNSQDKIKPTKRPVFDVLDPFERVKRQAAGYPSEDVAAAPVARTDASPDSNPSAPAPELLKATIAPPSSGTSVSGSPAVTTIASSAAPPSSSVAPSSSAAPPDSSTSAAPSSSAVQLSSTAPPTSAPASSPASPASPSSVPASSAAAPESLTANTTTTNSSAANSSSSGYGASDGSTSSSGSANSAVAPEGLTAPNSSSTTNSSSSGMVAPNYIDPTTTAGNSSTSTTSDTNSTTGPQSTTTSTSQNATFVLGTNGTNSSATITTGPGNTSSSTSSSSAGAPSSLTASSRSDIGDGSSSGSAANSGYSGGSSGNSTTSFSSEDGHYQFAYEVKDPSINEFYSQQESQDKNVTTGVYKVLLPDGRTEVVTYTADEEGYHPKVEFQGEAKDSSTSGAGNGTHKNNQGGNEHATTSQPPSIAPA